MATWNPSIANSADDAQESGGTVTITGVTLNCNSLTGYMGFVFHSCPAPRGSIITAATLSLYFTSGSYDDPDVLIHCQANQNDAVFEALTNNISARSRTTEYTAWDATGVGTGTKTSPDFAAAVQEQINDASYSEGGRVIVIIKGNSNGSLMRVNTYDNGSNIPALNLTYTPPGSLVVPRRRLAYTRF